MRSQVVAGRLGLLCLGILLIFLLAACARAEPAVFDTPTAAVVIVESPTAALTATVPAPPLPSPSPTAYYRTEVPQRTPTPNCQDDLRFVEDLTVPDGTQVIAGEQIDKRWQVQNAGTCNWDVRYQLRLLDGNALGAVEEQSLYPARAGTQAVIRILFQAPAEPGVYRSAWEAVDPNGNAFGDPIYIEIQVITQS